MCSFQSIVCGNMQGILKKYEAQCSVCKATCAAMCEELKKNVQRAKQCGNVRGLELGFERTSTVSLAARSPAKNQTLPQCSRPETVDKNRD